MHMIDTPYCRFNSTPGATCWCRTLYAAAQRHRCVLPYGVSMPRRAFVVLAAEGGASPGGLLYCVQPLAALPRVQQVVAGMLTSTASQLACRMMRHMVTMVGQLNHGRGGRAGATMVPHPGGTVPRAALAQQLCVLPGSVSEQVAASRWAGIVARGPQGIGRPTSQG